MKKQLDIHKINYYSAPYRGAKGEAAKELGISVTNLQSKLANKDLDAVRTLAKIVKARHNEFVAKTKQAKQEAIINLEHVAPAEAENID